MRIHRDSSDLGLANPVLRRPSLEKAFCLYCRIDKLICFQVQSGLIVHIFHVSAEIAALSEGLLAPGADKGSLPRVFPEVVPQVAALFEHAIAAIQLAFEEHLKPQGCLVANLDCLVPVVWDSRERFRVALRRFLPLAFLRLLELLHFKLCLGFVDLFICCRFLSWALLTRPPLPLLRITIINLP